MYTVIALIILALVLFPLVRIKSRPLEEVLNTSDPTDKEFIRQLGPELSPNIALKVRRLVADVSCYEMKEIWPDTPLGEVLD